MKTIKEKIKKTETKLKILKNIQEVKEATANRQSCNIGNHSIYFGWSCKEKYPPILFTVGNHYGGSKYSQWVTLDEIKQLSVFVSKKIKEIEKVYKNDSK